MTNAAADLLAFIAAHVAEIHGLIGVFSAGNAA